MLGVGALGWPRGMVWRGRWEGGFRIENTCTPMADSCWCMAKPIQYCKAISLQLKYILKNLKKITNLPEIYFYMWYERGIGAIFSFRWIVLHPYKINSPLKKKIFATGNLWSNSCLNLRDVEARNTLVAWPQLESGRGRSWFKFHDSKGKNL